MKHWKPDLRGLSAQMILSFVALVLLTAAAAGLPGIWLIRDQLERQAWAQVEQGSLAARALYEAKQIELQSLATLTAQRPTLREMLADGEQDMLPAYLRTLQEGSGLDLVFICAAGQSVAQAGETAPPDLCTQEEYTGFYAGTENPLSRVWLLAAHPIDDENKEAAGAVIVGMAMDDQFAAEMRA